jgi:hypothetical protein
MTSSASGAMEVSAWPMDSGGMGVPSGRPQVSRDSPEAPCCSGRWRPADRSSARIDLEAAAERVPVDEDDGTAAVQGAAGEAGGEGGRACSAAAAEHGDAGC